MTIFVIIPSRKVKRISKSKNFISFVEQILFCVVAGYIHDYRGDGKETLLDEGTDTIFLIVVRLVTFLFVYSKNMCRKEHVRLFK